MNGGCIRQQIHERFYLNPENEDTDTTTTANGVTATTAPTTNVGQPKAAKPENVEDAFDQLFNQ